MFNPTAIVRILIPISCVILCGLLTVRAGEDKVAAKKSVKTVSVPLRDGRFYSSVDLRRALSDAGVAITEKPVVKDGDCELTQADRGALLAGQVLGLWQVSIDADKFVLSFAKEEPDRHEQIAARLKTLFGVESVPPWPAARGIHLPTPFDPAARTILLVHGLESSLDDIGGLKTTIEAAGVQIIYFDYPNDGPIARAGDRFNADLKQLTAQFPDISLAIVAHSMGGLVARYALEKPDSNALCVRDLFLLGTPNGGSHLASMQPALELVKEVLPKLRLRETLEDGWGEAADDLKPNSLFLKDLNHRGRNKRVRYHVAIGAQAFVRLKEHQAITREIDSILVRRDVPDGKREAVAQWLHKPEFLDGQGDGAVSVQSARLSGADSERVFDLNHVELASPQYRLPQSAAVVDWILDELNWK